MLPWLVLLGLALLVVVAWGMWLAFCRSITKSHGIDALKAAPPIARAFPVNQWFEPVRLVSRWLGGRLDRRRAGD